MNRSIRWKLLASFLVLGLLPLAVVGTLGYQRSRDALLTKAGQSLQGKAGDAAATIDRVLFERYGDVQAFAFHPAARGKPDQVVAAANFFTASYGYYDLMVVADADGKVVAANTADASGKAVATGFLLGQSVKGQPWFEECISGKVAKGKSFAGDAAIDPWVAKVRGGRGLVMNFSAPIYDEKGKIVRVWSNRTSFERTASNVIEALRASMQALGGKTAYAQITARSGVLLHDPDPAAVLSLNPAALGLGAAQKVIQGASGFDREAHKRTGLLELIAYAPERGFGDFKGFGWGVLVRQDANEVAEDATALRNFTVGTGLAAGALIIAIALLIAGGIAQPLIRAVQVLEKVAAGDLTPRLDASGSDELGRMAAALNRALEKIGAALGAILVNSVRLEDASGALAKVSDALGASAEKASSQASSVAAASEEVGKNIHTVAAGSEEMGVTIKEIAKNASQAAQTAGEAVQTAEATNRTVERLGKSSIEIGNVVKLITAIAEQTNLLALNATIEAARAGEAGKGFAVVATEVKELAKQSAKATEDIGHKIAAIQGDAQGALKAIAEIGGVVGRISELQSTIATAVEEQAATTDEIGRNVTEAAQASADIARNVTGVAAAARETASGSGSVRSASAEMSRMAVELRALLGQFRTNPAGERREEAGAPAAAVSAVHAGAQLQRA